MIRRLAGMLVLLVALWSAQAGAHGFSTAYLTLSVNGRAIDVQWDIALRDLDTAVGLDTGPDGAVTWGGLKGRKAAIEAYAMPRLRIGADAAACPLGPVTLLTDRHGDGGYAVLRFAARCPEAPARITLAYDLLFELDPQHRGLVKVLRGDDAQAQVMSPAQPNATFAMADDLLSSAGEFFLTGLDHILTGYDHLLFIAVLLFPAIFVRNGGRWQPAGSLRVAFIATVKTLTAFTLAHALTLTGAATGLIHLPSRLTESAIAATILLTAIDNIRPIFGGKRWMLGFGFGLIHGLGFASALGPLDLPPRAMAVALLSFNLGIEAIQVTIVVVVLPLAYQLRRRPTFPRRFVPMASGLAAMMALFWLVDRAFGLGIAFG